MTKSGFSILLILMITISPIASAFANCSDMLMPVHLSATQSISVLANHLNHNDSINKKQSEQAASYSHSSNSCAIHLCAADVITLPTLIFNTTPSLYYSAIAYRSPYNTALPPDIKPPIYLHNRG